MADVDRGVLVVADISGYTRFVSGVELEHSTAIVSELLGAVVEQLAGVATLAKFEGDAAFCAARDPISAPSLTAALFGCYDAFRRRLRDARHLTTCTCDACREMVSLDLKVVVHHGAWIAHDIAGREELTGPDVIVVHRLLKNTVAERFGLRGYALLTTAAVDATGVDVTDAKRFTEEVDDVGSVELYVLDLPALWEAEQERAAVVVEGEGARELVFEMAATPAELWEWFSDPARRVQWNQADRIDVEPSSGTSGVGTVNHCVHGKSTITEEILDWKPYRYCTLLVSSPVGKFMMTVTMVEHEGGTTLTVRVRPAARGVRALPVRLALNTKVKKDFTAGMGRLAALVRAAPA